MLFVEILPQESVAMTSYRTDKTSRVVLALFVAYTLGYGVARNSTLQLIDRREAGSNKQYVVKTGTTSASGWESALFWPAIKLEETTRSIVKEISSYF